MVGPRDSAPTRDVFHYRIVEMNSTAPFSLQTLEGVSVQAGPGAFALPDGCYALSIEAGAAWSLCGDVGEATAGAEPFVFCITQGVCAAGTRAPAAAATEYADESAFSGLEKNVKFVLHRKRGGALSCSGEGDVALEVAVAHPGVNAPACAVSVEPAFDRGDGCAGGQVFKTEVDLPNQKTTVEREAAREPTHRPPTTQSFALRKYKNTSGGFGFSMCLGHNGTKEAHTISSLVRAHAFQPSTRRLTLKW